MANIDLGYKPQPRQWLMHNAEARQILYGGAAGGGKSHAIRWDAITFCLQNPGMQAYLFRRSRTQLISTHIRRIKMELPVDLGLGIYSEVRSAYEFYNNSVLYFCYADRPDDVFKYLSEEIHWLGIDEASQMLPSQLGFLCTRVRLGGWRPSNETDAKRLPRVIYGTNPGGPSHNYLKFKFIDVDSEPEQVFYDRDMRDPRKPEDKGWTSIYIPAKMDDNTYLDADYAASFGAIGAELSQAYREGDWNVVLGAALHNLSAQAHKIRSFKPPHYWTTFMVMDWGVAKPFSVGWYCVSDGAYIKAKDDHPEVYLPAGALVRFRELYGWSGKPDTGCRWSPQKVAKKILEVEDEYEISVDHRIADYEMWAAKSGIISTIDRFVSYDPVRFQFRQSIKDRRRNYNEILARLSGDPEFAETGVEGDFPMLYATENCKHFWRTVPVLTLEESDPEKGPNTKQEDHVYDELAYACASQPYTTTKEEHEEEEWQETLRQARAYRSPYAAKKRRGYR